MTRLAETVVLRDPSSGAPVALLAGTEIPEWAAGLITNPAVLTEDSPDEGPEGDQPDEEQEQDSSTSDSDEGFEGQETDGEKAEEEPGNQEQPDAEQAKPAPRRTRKAATK